MISAPDIHIKELSAPEPLELTYPTSFLAQYRWHLTGYMLVSLLGAAAIMSALSMGVDGEFSPYFWMYAGLSTLYLMASGVVVRWWRQYKAISLLVEEEKISSQPFIAQFE